MIFLRQEQRTVTLIVDSAREYRSIPANAIRPIEETLAGVDGNYLRGVATLGDRLVLLLDIAAVLTLDQEPVAATLPALQPSA